MPRPVPPPPARSTARAASRLLALAAWLLPAALAAVDAPVDFARDIAPILAESCVDCHGPDKHKGDLRLDSRQWALTGGLTGTALVPGNSAKSLLITRISADSKDEPRMPLKKPALPPGQLALLARWIDQGAVWPDSGTQAAAITHWAYVKPAPQAPPAVKDQRWVRTPIDRFVLARLEREGLAPEAEADRATLMRRLHLDLTGLPPSPSEVDAFLAAKGADAYEALVDRLLASPHYGERWARPWLDLARYADTNGYEKDNRRSLWPWRDWVIAAFNRDLPFDQFTIEQIAGDLLPGATRDQRVATGFHRNTMLNEEEGVDRGELRWNILVDRVGTTAEVWLGSTLQCAQCHNHKYDPFSQREFYQMLAFFENADEPELEVMSEAETAARAALRERIAITQGDLSRPSAELAAAQAEWERGASTPVAWSTLPPAGATSASGTVLTAQADGSLLASQPAGNDVYTLKAASPLRRITALRLEALTDPSLASSGPGAAGNGNFVLDEIEVRLGGPGGERTLKLTGAQADYSQQDWPVAAAIDGNPATGWAVAGQTGKAHSAVFACAPVEVDAQAVMTVTLAHRSPFGQHLLGRFRIALTDDAHPLRGETLPPAIQAIVGTVPAQRSAAQVKELDAHYRTIAPLLAPLRKRLADLEDELKKLPRTTTLVLKEKPSDKTPTTRIRIRGAWLAPGDEVSAGVPAVLPPLPTGPLANRLTLARWLVDGANPLTARVTVNRLWEQLFGRGIVESSDDFGLQGLPPSHPELLDWLANEFVRQGWSMKAMLRLMVTSATYRQSSRIVPLKQERDPANALLARGPRFRVEAEMVRDLALASSGLLDRTIGGPSVFPLQPEGIWNIPYNGDQWKVSEGGGRHRRGLYTFWRRTAPYPSFITFDAPSREVCVLRRPRTNTPLQALTVLNDPAFVEAARALARRMVAEGGPSADGRCAHGWRLCTSQTPSAADLATLRDLFARQRQRYAADPAAAAALIAGEHPGIDAADLAALVVVANVLQNLDQSITKE